MNVPTLQQAAFGGTRFSPMKLGVRLGQTWSERAAAALARYRSLLVQIDEVNNELAREVLRAQLGAKNTTGTPEYRYSLVLQDFVSDSDAYPSTIKTQRVQDLETTNDDLAAKIGAAKLQYGQRSASEPVSVPSQVNWMLPAGIGIGSLIITLLFFNR